ncbi:MAG: hypothetical protein RLZZ399_1793 [Verrucomicrobiota bacterium]|jgi:putative heme-binding domain-containing protein
MGALLWLALSLGLWASPVKFNSGVVLRVPDGFEVDLIYEVPRAEQGSWVAMCADPQGRILCADQYGDLYRVTPGPARERENRSVAESAPGGAVLGTRVEALQTGLRGAHGLLYAFESLYVMVNEGPKKGIHRLRVDRAKDGFFASELLLPLEGWGEHGPHSLQMTPDGKSVVFVCGNHTALPAALRREKTIRRWSEDHLLPRMWDPNGHALGLLAPGGYVAKMDPDGGNVALLSYGYRNAFDCAFLPNGDLFVYDSDMEWDVGMPWYRPTRISHACLGSDGGWRSGSGKWPPYYPDSVPPILELGPGSPTGMTSGWGARFPERYQRALFGCDWTYGTIYAIHWVAEGASYKARKEEFLSGQPLPVADLVVGPQDGALYFLTGGRRTPSALYRVRYNGAESTEPAAMEEVPAEAMLRRRMEQLQGGESGAQAVAEIWPCLSSRDRLLRYAARCALEKCPSSEWMERALREREPRAAIECVIALARTCRASLQPRLVEALGRIDYAELSAEHRLSWLRAWQLVLTRTGTPSLEWVAFWSKRMDRHPGMRGFQLWWNQLAKPSAVIRGEILSRLEPLFPAQSAQENQELLQLLVFLDSPAVVERALEWMWHQNDVESVEVPESLLERNNLYARAFRRRRETSPNSGLIAFASILRNATVGWTPERRRAYFGWFQRAAQWKGGNSFEGFLEKIRTDALEKVKDPGERLVLDDLSRRKPVVLPPPLAPEGPGKAYSVGDIVDLAKEGLHGRNFERGKAMFAATHCGQCHHFAGEGGNVGPDLSSTARRLSITDLAESLVEPSKVLSDQYAFERLERKKGPDLIGRIVGEQNGTYLVMTNPFAPDAPERVPVRDVVRRRAHPVSPMPPGLINGLNASELLDLIAYVMSGGNARSEVFAARE